MPEKKRVIIATALLQQCDPSFPHFLNLNENIHTTPEELNKHSYTHYCVLAQSEKTPVKTSNKISNQAPLSSGVNSRFTLFKTNTQKNVEKVGTKIERAMSLGYN